ncbi:peptidase U32 family protein [Williamwhitmania taraxaci]|uniref:Putative protease n=1 Tax=Williamwhitmania taraxaci TaxID=1640674 RepID=A0A1G6NX16_9BACT|nr:peptidase U32 family protein [Williamwhitmania taraxaci]SDC71884.1 putative protease [Williamwhitmania taraxaci]
MIGIAKREIELLAPGGDVDSIKAAIAAGANAVYCGLDRFNARNSAENISFDDLQGILRLAHKRSCEVFLTLNIIVVESEIPALITLLNKLVNTSLDGIIVQDLGVLYLLTNYFKGLKIHASTQLTTHNVGQIAFLSKLGVKRVNLSRELSIGEIDELTVVAHKHNILTEVFVHGSNCLCFSGICYISSVHGGNSGNRGRCSQPCRDQYLTTPNGNDFPLNLKDNSAFFDLKALSESGVDSIKIEGRIKKFHYVYTVVKAWRQQLQRLYNGEALSVDNSSLYKVFNRDFSNAFLAGAITRSMFIDNPRDHSAIHLAKGYDSSNEANLERAKKELYDDKTEIITDVKSKIDLLSIAKAPLTITLSGESGSPLHVLVETPDGSFVVNSDSNLASVGKQALNSDMVLKSLKSINDTEYYIEKLDVDGLQRNVFLPFKEFTSIKRQIHALLNSSREVVEPIDVPLLKRDTTTVPNPTLSILISSPADVNLSNGTSAQLFFQLPNGVSNAYTQLVDMFLTNRSLIPWFPSILIGDDYRDAIKFLDVVKPTLIVSNNLGIANKAYEMGIGWIAGPYLNVVNSFSLQCLKENFGCGGAFISNEISKQQVKGIKKPENFNLYYSIYHPIVLMTSRQCLFQQVDGCEKDTLDNTCIGQCERSSTITSLKNVPLRIEKAKGNYHCIYNDVNYLNTEIVTDIPNLFSSFCIDLRDIHTGTKLEMDIAGVAKVFVDYLSGTSDAGQELHRTIHPTTNTQYRKGI